MFSSNALGANEEVLMTRSCVNDPTESLTDRKDVDIGTAEMVDQTRNAQLPIGH